MFTQTHLNDAMPLTRPIAVHWLLVFSALACGPAASESIPNGMTRDEFAVVRGVIVQDTSWRLAIATDSRNSGAVAELRRLDSTYQPYFCRRSASGAPSSFAFVLVRADTFRVMFVSIKDRDSRGHVEEAARATWLEDGQVACREDGIDVAPFNSDELLSFRWNAATRKLELVSEEPIEHDSEP